MVLTKLIVSLTALALASCQEEGQPRFAQTGFPQAGFGHQPGFFPPGGGFQQPGFGHGGVRPGGGGFHGGAFPGGFGGFPGGFGGVSAGQTFNPNSGLTNTDPVLAFNCAATASHGQFGVDATCEKWCKTPTQFWGGNYVCCDDRPGFCPPVRSECPKFSGLGPVCCFVDSQCQIPTDKCCYDTCLGHKVCKSSFKQGI